MKADLTLHHPGSGQHLPLIDSLPGLGVLVGRLAAKVKPTLLRLSEALRPVSADEQYLARAQNIADLERRMLELQSRQNGVSSSFW